MSKPLSDEELYEAKELCVKLGECAATYYLVLLVNEVERIRQGSSLIPPFENGQRVMVNNERYHGEGIVQGDDGKYRRMVAVRLGNGNTWRYEVETATLVHDGQWVYDHEKIVPAS